MTARVVVERGDEVTDLTQDWTLQLDAMPHSPITGSGSTGEVSFSAPTSGQTPSLMYNGAVFEYYSPRYLEEIPSPSMSPLPPPVVTPPGGTSGGWGQGSWGDDGGWGGSSAPGTNRPPVASFTVTPNNLSVALNATSSSDPDGSITFYAWTFGDGVSGNGVTTSHTYAAAGTYTITLQVTDNLGARSQSITSVTVSSVPVVNPPPIASFTATPSGLAVSLNASASSDPNGSIVAYAWTFGDGASGAGVTTTHTYALGGTYTITLRVTDNLGAQSASTTSITVSAPSTTGSGWGTEAWGSDPWGA